MILITIECKWKKDHREVMSKINEIGYFQTNRKMIDNVLENIEDKSIRRKVLENGAFCDEDKNCKTIVLFLAGSGKFMEIRIQCYGEFIDNAPHIISEKEKIMNYIKQKKIKKKLIFNRKILSKITRDELKIESIEFVYRKISTILGIKSLIPVYFSSFALIISYVINLFQNPFIANIYLVLFLTSLPINLIIMISINYLGRKKYAYQI